MPTANNGTPFQEAIDFMKAKVRIPSWTWTDVYEAEHARGFTVAGAMKDDLLRDFQSEIRSAIENGTTIKDFRAAFDDIVKRHGWEYNGSRGWRTRTIFNTNMRQARMAGRYAQAKRMAEQGHKVYLRYVAVMDRRTRDKHRAWHDIILPIDHPFWDTHYPMNGWGCRCYVQVLTERDLKRRGLKVSDDPEVIMERHVLNTPDGKRTVTAPKGVAPGFAANPGKAGFGQHVSDAEWKAFTEDSGKKFRQLTPGDWRAAKRPAIVPADKAVAKTAEKAANASDMAAMIEKAIGGPAKTLALPDGSTVLIDAARLAKHLDLNRSPFIPFLPELLQDPFEVWATFEQHELTGYVALRKRIVKVIEVGGKAKGAVLVANAHRGVLTGWTYLPLSRSGEVAKRRVGRLLYGRDE